MLLGEAYRPYICYRRCGGGAYMASYGFGLHHFLVHRCRFLGVYPAYPFGYRSKAA